MDADEPQGNPCLAEKLKQDFSVDLPELDVESGTTATDYFSSVGRALRSKKSWRVHPTIALGFFNFARYRLWLDLNPSEWPAGQSPTDHPIVGSILNGEPLPQQTGIPGDDEVATHQASADLPLVMDADGTQYAALLAASKGVSLVVQGPPGSGKSQTITNLIAIAMAEGKRVLFVAQKLPALEVVKRRLDSVQLSPFCLPLFSDKARISEIHRHLASSARLRENPESVATKVNQVVGVAKQLSAHAARLRLQPSGYSQSACCIIQHAVALQLMLCEVWGDAWNDDLYKVTVPDGEPPSSWLEKREQTLNKWHLLKTEVGKTWNNWTPLKLSPMDVPSVEAMVRVQQRAATSIAIAMRALPRDYALLTIDQIKEFACKVKQSRFSVLVDVMPNLLAFLWQAPESGSVVARLEHDLAEFLRQLEKAQKHLQIPSESRSYIASRATDALRATAPVISPHCTLAASRAALEELNEVVRLAADFCSYASLSPSGIHAIHRIDTCDTDLAAVGWRQAQLLANHLANPKLEVPNWAKVFLARYIHESGPRQAEARELGQRLQRFHECSARLKVKVTDWATFQEGAALPEFREAIRCLCQHRLGGVKASELPDLQCCFGKCA